MEEGEEGGRRRSGEECNGCSKGKREDGTVLSSLSGHWSNLKKSSSRLERRRGEKGIKGRSGEEGRGNM